MAIGNEETSDSYSDIPGPSKLLLPQVQVINRGT